jgi:multiple sugar transport system ATP-binding protein
VNTFVAQFIGAPSMNMLPGILVSGGIQLWNGSTVALEPARGRIGLDVILGVRPEDLNLADGAGSLLNGVITVVEPLGSETLMYVDVGGHEIIASGPGRDAPMPGDHIHLQATPQSLHVFDKTSGAALS